VKLEGPTGIGELRRNGSEEIEKPVNAIVRFPELREESEYAWEVAVLPGAHHLNPFN